MSQAGQPHDRSRRNMRGGARLGSGGTNYLTIGADGGITQTGTGMTNTLTGGTTISGTLATSGVQTITAAPVLSGSGRPTHSLFVPAALWTDTASTSESALNSRWNSIAFAPAASETDVTIYAQAMVPREMDVTSSGGFTAVYVVTSLGALAASGTVDWRLTVNSVESGAGSDAGSTLEIAKGASFTSATANVIQNLNLGTIGGLALADGDLLSLALQLCGSSTYTSAGCPYLLGVRMDYYADTL